MSGDDGPESLAQEQAMAIRISGRNQLPGKVIELLLGDIMAQVVVQVGEFVVEAVITRRSAEQMGLKVGDEVSVLVKATEAMVIKEMP
ncbi:ABC transporter solute-binding protein [Gloeobacter violaceus PCC 7421]|uniref:ABC transporter solute-binding protein n=2 Tax=Gloeobacter violaceus TaxID=33072 RepID=Q7NDF1_GLOVI|nr:ABC transporter solute-binding protein [Gloeobacter violaceus PCC 7421]